MKENDGFDITTDEQQAQIPKFEMGTWISVFFQFTRKLSNYS